MKASQAFASIKARHISSIFTVQQTPSTHPDSQDEKSLPSLPVVHWVFFPLQITLPQCLAISSIMEPAVHAIRTYHNRNVKALNPSMPATMLIPITPMATTRTSIRMSINPTATTPITIRMPTILSATIPTTKQMPATPSATAPAHMATRVLDKTLMVAHNPLIHRMGTLTGILSSTSRT